MATRIINTTETWQELATGDCIIQNLKSGDFYVKYADTLPTDGLDGAFVVNTSSILNLPAPISGFIYVASKNNARIAVEDF